MEKLLYRKKENTNELYHDLLCDILEFSNLTPEWIKLGSRSDRETFSRIFTMYALGNDCDDEDKIFIRFPSQFFLIARNYIRSIFEKMISREDIDLEYSSQSTLKSVLGANQFDLYCVVDTGDIMDCWKHSKEYLKIESENIFEKLKPHIHFVLTTLFMHLELDPEGFHNCSECGDITYWPEDNLCPICPR